MTCTLEISWPTPVLAASRFAFDWNHTPDWQDQEWMIKNQDRFFAILDTEIRDLKMEFLGKRLCEVSFFTWQSVSEYSGQVVHLCPGKCLEDAVLRKCMYDMIFLYRRVKIYCWPHLHHKHMRTQEDLYISVLDWLTQHHISGFQWEKSRRYSTGAYYRMLAPFRHGCMPHLHPSVNFWQATFFRYEKLWHDKTKDEHLIRHALKRCTIYFPTCTTLFTVSIFPYRIVMCISSCSPCPKYIEIDHDILEYIVDHEILR